MSYIKQKADEVPADNLQGTIAPDQVAYGDPDNSGKIKGSDKLTYDQTTDTVTITSEDDGGAVKPILELFRDSASPASGDDLGQILFNGKDSANAKQTYFQIKGEIRDPSSTSDDGELIFIGPSNSVDVEFMRMSKTVGVVVNEGGTSIVDFRVEGDTETNLLRTDGSQDNVGIGTAPDSTTERLHIKGDGNVDLVKLETTDDTSSTGPDLVLYRNSASPSANDFIGRLDFRGKDGGGSDNDYGIIATKLQDTGTGTGKMVFFANDGTGVNLNNGQLEIQPNNVVVNEAQRTVNFRVESLNNGSLFRTSAGQDNIGMGVFPASDVERLHIRGQAVTENPLVRFETLNTAAASGPHVEFYRNSASPADGDDLGEIKFVGNHAATSGGASAGAKVYSRIINDIRSPITGSENGMMRFQVVAAGTLEEFIRLDSQNPAIVLNDGGIDMDFRVEGNSAQSLIRTNGAQDNVGINTNPLSGLAGAKPMLHVKAEDDNIGILIEDDAADADMGPEMVLYRSSGSPAVNDLLGRIRFEGQDSGGNPHTYFRMSSQIKDPTDASEDGNFFFTSRESGALFDVMKINGASLEINPNTNSNINLNVRTNLTTQAQSFFRTYNNTDIAERYTELLRGSRTITSTPVTITADRCYGSNIVLDTGASVVNLPEAVPGMHLQVVNKNISGTSVAPASGDTINGSTSAYSIHHGWVIAKVICIADGEWVLAEAF